MTRSIEGLPLRSGDEGPAVRDLQDRLSAVGHAVDRRDGDRFGASTELAVRSFQAQRRLTEDGVCGIQTWLTLVEAGYRLGDRYLYLRTPMLRGDDVTELQRRLSALGFDPGRVDGILGADTERALKDLQRNLGLIVDGVCGRDVLAELARLVGRAAEGDVAGTRERALLRHGSPELTDKRIVIGDLGGLDALTHAVCRSLGDRGAHTVSLSDPDESAQAAAANQLDAAAYVGLRLTDASSASIEYYRGSSWSSPGGSLLATILVERLMKDGLPVDAAPRGMSVTLLRETRMPAILCRLGPPSTVVGATSLLAAAVSASLAAWVAAPVDP